MEPIGHDTDDVAELRSRLADQERRWESAAPRLAAFARLEELAEAQATTPEVLAARAALSATEAHLGDLQAEADALGLTVADLTAEVERLEQERDQAHHRLDQLATDVDRRSADLEAVEREVTALLVTRAERAAEVDELTRTRDELCAEVAEFLEGLEDLRSLEPADGPPRVPSPAGVLAGATPPEYSEDGDSAFSQFFETEFEHDKSRQWMLAPDEATGSTTEA